jgi:hypothetical protein
MRPCRYCSVEMADGLTVCPHCGRAQDEGPGLTPGDIQVRGGRKLLGAYGCAILSLFVMLLALAALYLAGML